jgi:hypothetical protein
MIKINIFLTLILLTGILPAYAQCDKIVMYSNKKNITMYIGEGKNDWTITPSLKPDILWLYNPTETSKKIKFISDIDSLIFNVEVNKPIYFSVIYNKDTAFTAIEFTNYIPNTLTNIEKLYALALFWSEAKYNFAFIDKLDFDLDSLYKAFIPKVLETKNNYEFYDQMQLFAGCFKDGHTNVSYNKKGVYTDYIAMSARYFDNELYIIRVREDLADMYPVGSKILEINNMPVADYMKKHIDPYVESDFKPTLKFLSSAKLFSSNLFANTLTIKYEMPDKKIFINTPPRNGNAIGGKSVGYQFKRWEKPIEITWTKDDIAVLGFHSFNEYAGRSISYFETIKDTLYHAKGIIIDLRQNGGGATNVAWHLLQYIIKDSYFLNIGSQTRINDGAKRANGNWIPKYEDFYTLKAYHTEIPDTIYISDTIKRFNVPMVILISSMTVSAAEDFLIMLYEREDRPKFIGQPSFGSTGSPLVIWDWPDSNGFGRVCARRVLFPYSLKPFTEGIMPDILVDYSFEEFMSGKDKEIEISVQELEKQIKDKSKKNK